MDLSMNSSVEVGLVAENSPDFISKVFNCWNEDCVVVPLRSPDDHYRIAAARVSEVRSAQPGFGWLAQTHKLRFEDRPAQMLFTSGTEGEPKCIVLSHSNLADVVVRLNAAMQLTAEVREYVGVPVYHSFGFGRCRAVLAAGGKVYIPPRGFNPNEINGMLERGEINALSAVPSLWRLLLQSQAISKAAAAQMRWIEIGSQSMSAQEKVALRELFHQAVIVQHYGLTEASRSTFLQVHSASAVQLESVGQAHGNVEISIAESGRILIRGPHVASKILNQGVYSDPRDSQGWLATNDLGYLREGYLYYQGRADDQINCGGIKLSPDDLELAIARSLNMQADLAVCRVPDPLRGDGILVAVSADFSVSDADILKAALEASASLGVSALEATHVMRVKSLARTQTGKVKRKQIAQDFVATRKATSEATPQQGTSLRARLAVILGVPHMADHDTFVDLGGDSMRYIQASMALEDALGFLPESWEKSPVVELEALLPKPSKMSQIEPSVLLRALAIISVVANHSGMFENVFAIDGAAVMLLLPAGYSFARFQLQRVLQTGLARMALGALPRVVAPAFLLIAIQQFRHSEFEPSALLLFQNFLNEPEVFGFWFIEVFVQMHLMLACLLWFPRIRADLQRNPWVASMAGLVVSACVSLLAPLVWDTTALHNLVPHLLLPFFLLGWCLLFADTARQRWANAVAALVVVVAQSASQGTAISGSLWLMYGALFLNWAPVFRMPTWLVRSLGAIASASLYIYVSHFVTYVPVLNALPGLGAVASTAVQIALGLAYWFCFEKVWQAAAQLVKRHPIFPDKVLR